MNFKFSSQISKLWLCPKLLDSWQDPFPCLALNFSLLPLRQWDLSASNNTKKEELLLLWESPWAPWMDLFRKRESPKEPPKKLIQESLFSLLSKWQLLASFLWKVQNMSLIFYPLSYPHPPWINTYLSDL